MGNLCDGFTKKNQDKLQEGNNYSSTGSMVVVNRIDNKSPKQMTNDNVTLVSPESTSDGGLVLGDDECHTTNNQVSDGSHPISSANSICAAGQESAKEGRATAIQVLSGRIDREAADQAINSAAQNSNNDTLTIKLLPHKHTLFCERKQRVCSAVGRLQELEVIQATGFVELPLACVWIRMQPAAAAQQQQLATATATSKTTSTNGNNSSSGSNSNSNRTNINEAGTAVPPSSYTVIAGSENDLDYHLSKDDVGYCVGFRYEIYANSDKSTDDSNESSDSCRDKIGENDKCAPVDESDCNRAPIARDTNNSTTAVCNPQQTHPRARQFRFIRVSLGPVLPGPPRLLELSIKGDSHVGGIAVAEANYIGGQQGQSEFWWMRVTTAGRREQLTEPRSLPVWATEQAVVIASSSSGNSSNGYSSCSDSGMLGVDTVGDEDPRLYRITADDLGCTLKVKCRPIRDDGAPGEIFTSKSSCTLTATPPDNCSSDQNDDLSKI